MIIIDRACKNDVCPLCHKYTLLLIVSTCTSVQKDKKLQVLMQLLELGFNQMLIVGDFNTVSTSQQSGCNYKVVP